MQCIAIVTSNDLDKINAMLADGWTVAEKPPPEITLLPPQVRPLSAMYAEEFEPPPPLYFLVVVLEKTDPSP